MKLIGVFAPGIIAAVPLIVAVGKGLTVIVTEPIGIEVQPFAPVTLTKEYVVVVVGLMVGT